MFITEFTSPNVVNNTLRQIFAVFDGVSYGLLALLYKLFYAVASTEIFKAATISQIYSRVQLIIGVFMVFVLTMSVIKGIINPDTFTDSKTGGSALLIRVAISLVMLAMLVPINIPSPNNEYEKQINNNGILFGTLYSLQNRILGNNTIGRLILGTDDTGINYTNLDDDGMKKLDSSSRMFASSILRAFYRLNAKEDDSSASACNSVPETIMELYETEDQDPMVITHLVNQTCDTVGANVGKIWYTLTGDGSGVAYMFSYTPILPSIVAIVLAIVLIIYIIEVAKRAIKLAILRLIAPIPIISYIDSKNGKDNSLSTWTKMLIETYVSLFVRLAIMYFVMFIIQNLLTNGISINITGGFSGYVLVPFTTIFIIIGLFLFAKDAPKFIRKALGLKDSEGSFFGDIGKVVGLGVSAAGAIGSARIGYRAASAENAELHAGSRVNWLRNVGSAITSGIAGGYAGAKAAMSDKGSPMAAVKAIGEHNARRSSHATMIGGIGSDLHMLTHGRSLAKEDQLALDASKEAASATKDYKSTVVDEAMKKGKFGIVTDKKDRTGKLAGKGFNYRNLEAAMQSKDSNGNFDFEYDILDNNGKVVDVNKKYTIRRVNNRDVYIEDVNGTHTFSTSKAIERMNVSWFDANTMASIEDTQAANYLNDNYNVNTRTFENDKINSVWRQAEHALSEADIKYEGNYLGDISRTNGGDPNSDTYAYGDIGATIGTANRKVADMQTKMENIMHRANERK